MIARLLICTSIDRLREEISKTLASHGMSEDTNHPDLLRIKIGEKLGITEAKRIKDFFSIKPYSASGKAVVLEDASTLTTQAQNALLKTIEELPDKSILILGTPADANLLPTIISRCQVIRLQVTGDRGQEKNYAENIEKLLNSSIEERFEYIEKLKDKEEFLHSLAKYFHQNLLNYPKFTKELLQTEKWAKQNVNIRAVLEYLMLVMP